MYIYYRSKKTRTKGVVVISLRIALRCEIDGVYSYIQTVYIYKYVFAYTVLDICLAAIMPFSFPVLRKINSPALISKIIGKESYAESYRTWHKRRALILHMQTQ